jgi:hypothetical protein
MRFKGYMPETETLLRVVALLNRVSKKCILRLTPDDFVFIIAGDSDGLVTWAGIPMASFFFSFFFFFSWNSTFFAGSIV